MTVLDKLLQPIWEISRDPVVITSGEADLKDRTILYVNRAFTELNGYSSGEAVGQPATLLHGAQTSPDDVRFSEGLLQSGRYQDYTLLHYRKDGSTYRCNIMRAPLIDADGESEYLIEIQQTGSGLMETANDQRASSPGMVPLTLPMPLRELHPGEQPQHLASHPELDALKELWLEVARNRSLPRRRDFDLNVMKRWAPHISIATVMPDGRFQFRLFGTELSRVYGRDLTGCFLDELTPKDLWSVIIQHYKEVVRTREPLYAPVSVTNGRWYTEVSRLLLPLTGDDEVNFIMGADYARERL